MNIIATSGFAIPALSSPITTQTTYTLSCIDAGGATLTNTATVKIIPTFQEI